eukprot:c31379_g1_i1 orf=72-293(-)
MVSFVTRKHVSETFPWQELPARKAAGVSCISCPGNISEAHSLTRKHVSSSYDLNPPQTMNLDKAQTIHPIFTH